ncbi:MAG: DUF484 family protein [Gammaproteobacteria bacterium]|nr:DUF484 family protein [Gammaproteobacteria bacterium]MDH4253730.1 DUF484 family protein [Gammaproteobacteria bacterium]MDH5309659.1 DUF484 family protein [Gammaproteobacteria bacterium]
MSTQRKPEIVEEAVSDESVRDYLAAHPDFFERHRELLGTLRLPHQVNGTISLVERQVSVLRQKDLKLERKLKELLSVARTNDVLAAKIHQLCLRLLSADTLQATLQTCETALRTGFDADHAVLVLFRDPAMFDDIDAGRFFRPVHKDDPAVKPFATFLKGVSPRCGQIRDAQRNFLFGEDTNEIGSCALVPLGPKSELGFLAIGSADANRFHPAMSIDFLARIGDLIAAALKRY